MTIYYSQCATEFLKPGFYQGHIGDAMPLGMSNVLNTPIVILTSNKDNPILYNNTVGVIKKYTFPFRRLAFLRNGMGHSVPVFFRVICGPVSLHYKTCCSVPFQISRTFTPSILYTYFRGEKQRERAAEHARPPVQT